MILGPNPINEKDLILFRSTFPNVRVLFSEMDYYNYILKDNINQIGIQREEKYQSQKKEDDFPIIVFSKPKQINEFINALSYFINNNSSDNGKLLEFNNNSEMFNYGYQLKIRKKNKMNIANKMIRIINMKVMIGVFNEVFEIDDECRKMLCMILEKNGVKVFNKSNYESSKKILNAVFYDLFPNAIKEMIDSLQMGRKEILSKESVIKGLSRFKDTSEKIENIFIAFSNFYENEDKLPDFKGVLVSLIKDYCEMKDVISLIMKEIGKEEYIKSKIFIGIRCLFYYYCKVDPEFYFVGFLNSKYWSINNDECSLKERMVIFQKVQFMQHSNILLMVILLNQKYLENLPCKACFL